jgi:alkanesulfonate monooxygenase SsuD/methylene tetrahydromethanopterin reductase-like flavin-dependent oxidoreductase (luciferase family)
MDFGIALPTGPGDWRTAKRAEALGFSHVWFYDTQMLCADPFVAMALAAEHTTKIRLGTGVLVPSNRIAPAAANALASINRLAPGRVVFGVGTGFTARRTMGLGPMRLSALREYVRVVRALLAGETVEWNFEGAPRTIRFLNPEAGLIDLAHLIPLHFSAFAPRARALTAEIADGWMTFLSLLPLALHEAGEMDAACRARGRAPETLYRTAFTLGCVLADDADVESPRVRAQAGPLVAVMFHAVMEGTVDASLLPPDLTPAVAAYREVVAGYGAAPWLRMHAGHLMWIRPEEERFVTPDLIRTTTFTGTVPELRDRVRALRDAGYHQLAIQLVPGHEAAIDDWARVFDGV